MTIREVVDAAGRTYGPAHVLRDISKWEFTPPLLCGACRHMQVRPVRAHKRNGTVIEPTFAAVDRVVHEESGCRYASKKPSEPKRPLPAMPIRLDVLPGKPRHVDQRPADEAPLYPMTYKRPRRALRIGFGPASGNLVVQAASHAVQLISAVQTSIAEGNPPHDLVYEGLTIPWERFYFDTTVAGSDLLFGRLSQEVSHPIAVKMFCGKWELLKGRRAERLQASVHGQPKVFLATRAVAEEKLPRPTKSIVYYGIPSVLDGGYWMWIKDSREIAVTK